MNVLNCQGDGGVDATLGVGHDASAASARQGCNFWIPRDYERAG
jgi:hypothetical protein